VKAIEGEKTGEVKAIKKSPPLIPCGLIIHKRRIVQA
jgi:hypothetical protein